MLASGNFLHVLVPWYIERRTFSLKPSLYPSLAAFKCCFSRWMTSFESVGLVSITNMILPAGEFCLVTAQLSHLPSLPLISHPCISSPILVRGLIYSGDLPLMVFLSDSVRDRWAYSNDGLSSPLLASHLPILASHLPSQILTKKSFCMAHS